MEYADCYLKKGDSIIFGESSNSKGVVKLPKVEADSLCISFVFYDYVSIPLSTFSNDDLIIQLSESKQELKYYHFITSEKWKVRRNKLLIDSKKYLKVE